jgi:hypothetical protein
VGGVTRARGAASGGDPGPVFAARNSCHSAGTEGVGRGTIPDLGMLVKPLALLFGRVVPAVIVAAHHSFCLPVHCRLSRSGGLIISASPVPYGDNSTELSGVPSSAHRLSPPAAARHVGQPPTPRHTLCSATMSRLAMHPASPGDAGPRGILADQLLGGLMGAPRDETPRAKPRSCGGTTSGEGLLSECGQASSAAN